MFFPTLSTEPDILERESRSLSNQTYNLVPEPTTIQKCGQGRDRLAKLIQVGTSSASFLLNQNRIATVAASRHTSNPSRPEVCWGGSTPARSCLAWKI